MIQRTCFVVALLLSLSHCRGATVTTVRIASASLRHALTLGDVDVAELTLTARCTNGVLTESVVAFDAETVQVQLPACGPARLELTASRVAREGEERGVAALLGAADVVLTAGVALDIRMTAQRVGELSIVLADAAPCSVELRDATDALVVEAPLSAAAPLDVVLPIGQYRGVCVAPESRIELPLVTVAWAERALVEVKAPGDDPNDDPNEDPNDDPPQPMPPAPPSFVSLRLQRHVYSGTRQIYDATASRRRDGEVFDDFVWTRDGSELAACRGKPVCRDDEFASDVEFALELRVVSALADDPDITVSTTVRVDARPPPGSLPRLSVTAQANGVAGGRVWIQANGAPSGELNAIGDGVPPIDLGPFDDAAGTECLIDAGVACDGGVTPGSLDAADLAQAGCAPGDRVEIDLNTTDCTVIALEGLSQDVLLEVSEAVNLAVGAPGDGVFISTSGHVWLRGGSLSLDVVGDTAGRSLGMVNGRAIQAVAQLRAGAGRYVQLDNDLSMNSTSASPADGYAVVFGDAELATPAQENIVIRAPVRLTDAMSPPTLIVHGRQVWLPGLEAIEARGKQLDLGTSAGSGGEIVLVADGGADSLNAITVASLDAVEGFTLSEFLFDAGEYSSFPTTQPGASAGRMRVRLGSDAAPAARNWIYLSGDFVGRGGSGATGGSAANTLDADAALSVSSFAREHASSVFEATVTLSGGTAMHSTIEASRNAGHGGSLVLLQSVGAEGLAGHAAHAEVAFVNAGLSVRGGDLRTLTPGGTVQSSHGCGPAGGLLIRQSFADALAATRGPRRAELVIEGDVDASGGDCNLVPPAGAGAIALSGGNGGSLSVIQTGAKHARAALSELSFDATGGTAAFGPTTGGVGVTALTAGAGGSVTLSQDAADSAVELSLTSFVMPGGPANWQVGMAQPALQSGDGGNLSVSTPGSFSVADEGSAFIGSGGDVFSSASVPVPGSVVMGSGGDLAVTASSRDWGPMFSGCLPAGGGSGQAPGSTLISGVALGANGLCL